MGKTKQHPRYNVLSCRVSDDTRRCVEHARGSASIQDYLHAALEEKLTNDRQARIDAIIRKEAQPCQQPAR